MVKVGEGVVPLTVGGIEFGKYEGHGASACFCVHGPACSKAGRCLNGSCLLPDTGLPPSKLLATIDDDDVLRIARKVVELLSNENLKTGAKEV